MLVPKMDGSLVTEKSTSPFFHLHQRLWSTTLRASDLSLTKRFEMQKLFEMQNPPY
jgi:hypothetical protein